MASVLRAFVTASSPAALVVGRRQAAHVAILRQAVHSTNGLRLHSAAMMFLAASGRSDSSMRWEMGIGSLVAAMTALTHWFSPTRCETAEPDEEWIRRLTADATEELDIAAVLQRLVPHQSKRNDKQFVHQTLSSDRRIRSLRIWHFDLTSEANGQHLEDAVVGRTKLMAIVRLGDELNGHPGLIHGGFTSALLDDLFGWASALESRKFMGGSSGWTIFTANLNVNYRAPMRCDTAYSVEVVAEKIAKQKKVYLSARIRDAEGKLLVESTSLYLIVRQPS